MLTGLLQRISIWWRFKQLNKTFIPLIEKANAFNDRDAVLKLEEQYWYQTACLLEERRDMRLRRAHRKYSKVNPVTHGLPSQHLQGGLRGFASERDLARNTPVTSDMVVYVLMACILLMGIGAWLLVQGLSL